jgi:predicted metal-dependent enzyme (double-stranded beta helix superfamily)
MTAYEIQDFVSDIRAGIEQASTLEELMRRVQAHLARLLRNDVFLARDFGLPRAGDFRPRLLYVDRDYDFNIVATCFAAGEATPIHDHGGTWGVTGVYRNVMETRRFERLDDGATPKHGEIRLTEQKVLRAGDTTMLPAYGIHRESNPSGEPAVTLVVHERDLTRVWRNVYKPDAAEVKRVLFGVAMLPRVLSDEPAPAKNPSPRES